MFSIAVNNIDLSLTFVLPTTHNKTLLRGHLFRLWVNGLVNVSWIVFGSIILSVVTCACQETSKACLLEQLIFNSFIFSFFKIF